MGRYVVRRALIAIPTLIAIAFIIFSILTLAPGDPTANLPLSVPETVRAQVREALGLGEPFLIRFVKWLQLMLINEPIHMIESVFNVCIGDCENRARVISWASRGPALDVIWQRIPQTLWVLGPAFIIGILIAIPVGVISAYKQYSWFDNTGTFLSMLGYSVPTFFTGLLLIIIFSVHFRWLPSFYDTTHSVTDWPSFVFQVKQMIMPVAVIALFNAAALTRYTRASMLDNLNADYVRTARSKGMKETGVLLVHVLRNSLIPVVTLIALQLPGIFAGAIITEQIFRINGIGALLIVSIGNNDVPMVQTLTFIFAALIVTFNLLADVTYGVLDPRIRYD